jgi:hypothetical protein
MCDQLTNADLEIASLYNQLFDAGVAVEGKKRMNIKIVRPTASLQVSALDFDHDAIVNMMQQGYEMAKQQYIP